MDIFGYERNGETLLKLEEVSLKCTITELDELITFLNNVKETHATVVNQTDMCHSHFRDWSKTWQTGTPDLIIVTEFNK